MQPRLHIRCGSGGKRSSGSSGGGGGGGGGGGALASSRCASQLLRVVRNVVELWALDHARQTRSAQRVAAPAERAQSRLKRAILEISILAGSSLPHTKRLVRVQECAHCSLVSGPATASGRVWWVAVWPGWLCARERYLAGAVSAWAGTYISRKHAKWGLNTPKKSPAAPSRNYL